jgi:NADH-quinone oxidoreductase subunit E
MSVRRLNLVQPDSFEFTPENLEWARAQFAKYPPGRQAAAVIPLLWRAQEQNGWLSEPALRYVGDMLDMPYIRIYEIATFYSMFNLSPVGTSHVQLCGTTPCMLRGADDLKGVCEQKIGPKGSVSDDGLFSWVEVECLGACVNAPMVQINADYYEDLNIDSFALILDRLRAGQEVTPGPQTRRHKSAPASGLTSLTSASLHERAGSAAGRAPDAGPAKES